MKKIDTCASLKEALRRGEIEGGLWGRGGYPGNRLPIEIAPEIRSLGFWNASRTQSWGLDWHYNEGIEIGFLEAGTLQFQVKSEDLTLQSNYITITRPWERHRVGSPHISASRFYWIILDVKVRKENSPWRWPRWVLLSKDQLHQLTHYLQLNERPLLKANRAIKNTFLALGEILKSKTGTGLIVEVQVLINQLLLGLLGVIPEPEIPAEIFSSQKTVRCFLQGLPDHLDKEWDLDSMAKSVGLGRTQFAKHCKQLTNLTPLKYLNQCRVVVAQRRLASDTKSTITSVGFEVGFQSSQYFATVTRRVLGVSPKKLRTSGHPV